MPAKSLEAQVRHQPRVAIVDLEGEIDSFAEDVRTLHIPRQRVETQTSSCSTLAKWIISIAQVSLSSLVYSQEHENRNAACLHVD
jgi:hypothetical protein